MAQINTNDLKGGVKLLIDGNPYSVIAAQFVKPGKGPAFVKTTIKNLMNKKSTEKTFKSDIKIDLADVFMTDLEYLYNDGTSAYFMNSSTHEQPEIPMSNLGDAQKWLKDGTSYKVTFFNGEAIEVEPPQKMDLEVTESAPGEKGNTATNATKPATVETGVEIQVPLFIGEGDIVRVNTETGKYEERVSQG